MKTLLIVATGVIIVVGLYVVLSSKQKSVTTGGAILGGVPALPDSTNATNPLPVAPFEPAQPAVSDDAGPVTSDDVAMTFLV